jgi:hypothetical protein
MGEKGMLADGVAVNSFVVVCSSPASLPGQRSLWGPWSAPGTSLAVHSGEGWALQSPSGCCTAPSSVFSFRPRCELRVPGMSLIRLWRSASPALTLTKDPVSAEWWEGNRTLQMGAQGHTPDSLAPSNQTSPRLHFLSLLHISTIGRYPIDFPSQSLKIVTQK